MQRVWQAYTYAVDELGNMYRCWEDCGNVEASFGTVKQMAENPVPADVGAWSLYLGGCPHRHMVSGVRRCPWFKDDPDAYVLAKTRSARKGRQ